MKRNNAAAILFWILLLFVSTPKTGLAHPMGNFSINHYAQIDVHTSSITIRYILDMAEIPTVSERTAMDTNGDGKISDIERNVYLDSTAERLRNGVTLLIDGIKILPDVKPVGLEFVPGAGGLPTTRIILDMAAAVPASATKTVHTVSYTDGNYDARTGWKEIVVTADSGVTLEESNAPTTDLSRQLTVYPVDATIAPPQQTEAHFIVRNAQEAGFVSTPLSGSVRGSNGRIPAATLMLGTSVSSAGNTPRDPFTQAIARVNLSTGMVLLSLAIAFAFGALHGLSPGHGKAMMAAYLVGARGTARHAVLLGLVVTITHTLGVLALGLVMLFAAKFVVPERLYPALSALSGFTIAIMGAVLLRQRWSAVSSIDSDGAISRLSTSNAFDNVPLTDVVSTTKSQSVERNRPKQTDEGPLSIKSLVALGITGGILPCPSALVVLLSAVALHRVAFGLILIIAFSVGLALALTAIGICVVYMRALTERIPTQGKLLQRLPAMSAGFVMLIGLFLIFKSLRGGY